MHPSASVSMSNQSGAPDSFTDRDRPKSKVKKSRKPTVATPSDSESVVDDDMFKIIDLYADNPDLVGLDDEQSSSDDGTIVRVLHPTERSLREEANSL